METNGLFTESRPERMVNDLDAGEDPIDEVVHGRDRLQAEIDRLSLTQALQDTEIATARVIDLTERLVEVRTQLTSARVDLEGLRFDLAQYRASNERLLATRPYRWARRLSAVIHAVRG
jgi:hypothetical protein